MNIFLDTEFWDRGDTCEPISIGLVSENGLTLYAENNDFDWSRLEIPEWLHKNVKVHLQPREHGYARATIELLLRAYFRSVQEKLIDDREKIDIWAYYGASDWIIFRNLLGGFWSIPQGVTKWYRELAEIAEIRPNKSRTQHHALTDAQWNWQVWTINTQEKLV